MAVINHIGCMFALVCFEGGLKKLPLPLFVSVCAFGYIMGVQWLDNDVFRKCREDVLAFADSA